MSSYSYRPGMSSLFPPVIKNLLIINGLVFLAQIAPGSPLGAIIDNLFALWPIGSPDVVSMRGGALATVPNFLPWQIVTYGFLHASPQHLLFNMFGLWMFGRTLEEAWGGRQFTIYYFVCVMGGAILQLAAMYGQITPTVGASAGVLGVLLGFGMTFPNQEIMIIPIPVPIKAKWLVAGYGLWTVLESLGNSQDNVAHMAHLGGMVFGFLMIQYWRGRLPIKPQQRTYY